MGTRGVGDRQVVVTIASSLNGQIDQFSQSPWRGEIAAFPLLIILTPMVSMSVRIGSLCCRAIRHVLMARIDTGSLSLSHSLILPHFRSYLQQYHFLHCT